ncbi:MAG: type II/IV secretion system protein [SAR86 cluster bacterium BACL1 MAG-120920-bin57]|jgi:general secretion pathway protein E|uniref:General secretion pathway protein E n=1 Tax=SAR86 cluster bacterium BACL1 MAG-120920-bin57 TaxID=1655571 RepID=A0A0R2PSV6_9GAMM|nr:MAG: type II/IV secretion system protein [SAR86 cluster bacterium BACL1 MAG-120507-bin14]KRO41192.1 MAG: type II/IV secretion system protein [SAR86 cluster bacterium BACL1 MAG-120920-bin57]KRO98316.1 MAG: type II/IV secretion system protein [SAR86 cluster bacterium BACL1 MAG-120823-bin87]KRP00742.1 MAG: type II/IV secretion system protein [SAR86 cluster bacterium BACL1 MAG-120924-bin88]KRP15746.1 MAG: type II/IV secretion system protein [SAR86 cluster bacterium BACL1 MAG-121128-bin56]KRP167|tara:strand:+ start:1100 stop:2596 length:1497 start_codon:yes stop_codon:yes gene_type:complete
MGLPTESDIENISLPYDFARVHRVLAYSQDSKLIVVSEKKLTSGLYQELSRFLKADFQMEVRSPNEFDLILTQHYSASGDESNLNADFSENFDLQSFANTLAPTEDLLSGANDAPIIKLINGVLSQAIKVRASDIHFEPYEDNFIVRYRVDGILREVLTHDSRLSAPIISRLKIIARLDIAERRKPQDGRVSLSLGANKIDVRVSTLPSSYGERVVLRLLDKKAAQINITDLGLPNSILDTYKAALTFSEGIILVTGPTGSGKTTTLYSGLRHISDTSQNILTVEDPIEYTLPGIGQTQVNVKAGYDFASGLRSILRQDPDIVMLGEIRDLETAKIAIQASLTGHLVLSTVHTNSAIGAIARLRDMGIESYLLASSIRLVISQRLVRRLCAECKTSITPPESIQQKFSLDPVSPIYKANGCDSCSHSGFKGRVALAECISITEDLKALIHDEASENALAQCAFKNTLSIDASSTKLLLEGVTSYEELLKVQSHQDANL